MTWDWSYTAEIIPILLSGLRVTVILTVVSSVLALLVGLLLELLRRAPYVGLVSVLFVQLIRGTPLLIQLYVLFYLLPYAGLLIPPLWVAIIGLTVNVSAYAAEDYRAGIDSVPRAQREAATALGLSVLQSWRFVILPLALRASGGALGNEVNLMFKLSAMAYAITVTEMFHEAVEIGNQTFKYTEPLILVGVLYLAVSVSTTALISRLGKRRRHRKRAQVGQVAEVS